MFSALIDAFVTLFDDLFVLNELDYLENGFFIEEVSTTHVLNDSKYQDTDINKLDLSDRKININLM